MIAMEIYLGDLEVCAMGVIVCDAGGSGIRGGFFFFFVKSMVLF